MTKLDGKIKAADNPPSCRSIGEVAKDIAGQEEHHHRRGFVEELRWPVERYGLKWHEETVASAPQVPTPR